MISKILYCDIVKFLDSKELQDIFLSCFFSKNEWEIIKKKSANYFSDQFFRLIEQTKNQMPRSSLIDALTMVVKDVEDRFEKICEIFVMKIPNEDEKVKIEKRIFTILNNPSNGANIKFRYKIDRSIGDRSIGDRSIGNGVIFIYEKKLYDATTFNIINKLQYQIAISNCNINI